MVDNLILVLNISGVSLGMMACSILLFSNKTPKPANGLLVLILLGLVSIMIVLFLFEWNPDFYAYVYRFPGPLLFSLFPAGYLYVRTVNNDEPRLRKKDSLHFLPAFLYLVELIPHYLSPYQYRVNLVREIKNEPSKLIELNEGFLPTYFHLGILCIQGICYVVLIFILLKKKNRIQDDNHSATNHWMKIFLFLAALTAIAMILCFFGRPTFSSEGIQSLLVILTISLLMIKLRLFFQPEILYGIPATGGFSALSAPFTSVDASEEKNHQPQNGLDKEKKKRSNIDSENSPAFPRLATYQALLESYMQSKKPFLKQGYSIQDLSSETGIPQHYLSALLNRIYKQRFTDYINGMRICYIRQNFENTEWEKLTLEGIAKQAGFTSRTTFFNAIKKTSGVAPSEFIALLKKQHSKFNLPGSN